MRPKKAEWQIVLVLLCAGLVGNFLTYNIYPAVWTDELIFGEPAINLARTGHFTTSIWQLQPADTFWAAQSPLYPLVLSLWLRVWGFSLLAVRSFNLVLISISAWLVWLGSWKFRLVAAPWARVLLIPLILL